MCRVLTPGNTATILLAGVRAPQRHNATKSLSTVIGTPHVSHLFQTNHKHEMHTDVDDLVDMSLTPVAMQYMLYSTSYDENLLIDKARD